MWLTFRPRSGLVEAIAQRTKVCPVHLAYITCVCVRSPALRQCALLTFPFPTQSSLLLQSETKGARR